MYKYWKGDREAEGARLESVCTGKTVPGVQIPSFPLLQSASLAHLNY